MTTSNETVKTVKASKKNVPVVPVDVPVDVPVALDSFFSEKELASALELKEIENKQKEASKAAREASKSVQGVKIVHASLFRKGEFTITGMIEIALCVAARTATRVSPEQIEKFCASVMGRNALTHRGNASTSDRAYAHVRDCQAKYKSLYFSLDDKGMIVFTPFMKTKATAPEFIKAIDSLIVKIKG